MASKTQEKQKIKAKPKVEQDNGETDLRSLREELCLCADVLGEEVGVFVPILLGLLQVGLGLGQHVRGLLQVARGDGQLAGRLLQLLLGVREQLRQLSRGHNY